MKNSEMQHFAKIVASEVVKALKGNRSKVESEYVDTEEAARILGMSPTYLRSVKDRYPHIKVGNTKQGRIMFRRDSLLNAYNINKV